MIDSVVTAVDEWREKQTGRNQNTGGGGWKENDVKALKREDKR